MIVAAHTLARVREPTNAHWYHRTTGKACHEVPNKTKGGMRPTTLADAKKLDLVPSVTTVLKLLNAHALNEWKVEQAVLAVLTTPRLETESTDEFVYRVLHVEQHQYQEVDRARILGNEIHEAMQSLFAYEPISEDMRLWVQAPWEHIAEFGLSIHTEHSVIGDGYAGRADLVQECKDCIRVWDYKSRNKAQKDLPTEAYKEHRLQLAAYANAYNMEIEGARPIKTGNIYISTLEPGAFTICPHEPWEATYEAFASLVKVWQWQNQFWPGKNL